MGIDDTQVFQVNQVAIGLRVASGRHQHDAVDGVHAWHHFFCGHLVQHVGVEDERLPFARFGNHGFLYLEVMLVVELGGFHEPHLELDALAVVRFHADGIEGVVLVGFLEVHVHGDGPVTFHQGFPFKFRDVCTGVHVEQGDYPSAPLGFRAVHLHGGFPVRCFHAVLPGFIEISPARHHHGIGVQAVCLDVMCPSLVRPGIKVILEDGFDGVRFQIGNHSRVLREAHCKKTQAYHN